MTLKLRSFERFIWGLAVSVPEGLLVPVIRNVHDLDLKEIAQESARLAARCPSRHAWP